MRDLSEAFDDAGVLSNEIAEMLHEVLAINDLDAIDEVLLLHRGDRPDPDRRLLVIVHLGDYDGDTRAQAIARSELARAGNAGTDVAAVRRASCALTGFTPLSGAVDLLCTRSGRTGRAARVYYDPSTASSLTEIARDLASAMSACRRPDVAFVGAYADPEHGCVTALWRALIDLGLPAENVRILPGCLTATGVRDTPHGPIPGLEEGADQDRR